jgi:hypothetical protein
MNGMRVQGLKKQLRVRKERTTNRIYRKALVMEIVK